MKKSICKRILTLSLAGAMLSPAAYAADAGDPPPADDTDTFYQDLAELINSQDDTFYFDTIKLSIGSGTLTVDGTEQQMSAAPELRNGRTMLPIQPIAEVIGADVEYNASSQTVTITSRYGDVLLCALGADSMTVNEEPLPLDTPAYLQNEINYLPLRAVAEALDMEVEWDQDTASVIITAPYQTARILVQTNQALVFSTNDPAPEKTLTDGSGMWVLQFSAPADAKKIAEILTSQGIPAEPDLYMPASANNSNSPDAPE